MKEREIFIVFFLQMFLSRYFFIDAFPLVNTLKSNKIVRSSARLMTLYFH